MNKAFLTGITLPLLLQVLPLAVTAADMGQPQQITSFSAPTVDLKNDPPAIFFNTGPAILLIVQGDLVLSPIPKTDLRFVLNTNRDLFYNKKKHNSRINPSG